MRRAAVLQLLTPGCGGVLWRTRKGDLTPEELGIPAQGSRTTTLALSDVERFYYARQHQVRPELGGPASRGSGMHALRMCCRCCPAAWLLLRGSCMVLPAETASRAATEQPCT